MFAQRGYHDASVEEVAASRVAVADHNNGTVVLFDLRTRRQVGTVRVGAGPHGLATVAA